MKRAERPARLAIASVVTYIVVMAITSRIGRSIVERQAVAAGSTPSLRVMVAPEAVTPYSRSVVRDMGLWYEIGRLTWTPEPRYEVVGEPVVKSTNAATLTAQATPAGREFASWARFPFAETTTANGTVVRFDDVRYARPGQKSFASTTIRVSDGPR